jgi:hypothetical protein
VLSALLMFRRVARAFRYAVREEEFLPMFGTGALLVGDRDPHLVLDDGWIKVFTILYQVIGIGILVEVLRRLGLAFVEVRRDGSR